MSELNCLGCKGEIDPSLDACPKCGEKVTGFQRTYGGRLIDGKYQILQRLGAGGMGEIFKVRHIHLGEERVIKIMRANIAMDEQSLQRFFQEARMATMIKHRNLAMLYDFSTLEDGSYYMVWEYIEGINIQKWIAQNGPVPSRLAVEIAIQALAGLDSLHQMGVIHRDISPENIMLSQDYQGRLLVKVIDFGIAKQLSEGEGGHGLTATGMFLGKLKYASPEQAGFLKEGDMLDHRSDLYSFGVVFYEMLAGRAPFTATNPHGYILKHATEKPQPISQINPAVQVPQSLEALVLRALEKDRAARFADCAEFVDALDAIRPDISPDAKFGIGDRLTTMSGRPTVGEGGRPTRVGGMATTPSRPLTRPALTPMPRTVVDTEGATVVDRPQTSPTFAHQKTVLDETVEDAQPTVIEREPSGGAAPTVIEPAAAPSILSQPQGEPRSRTPLIAAVAAAVILAVIAAVFLLQPKEPEVEIAAPTATATQASIVVEPATSLEIPIDKGALLFSSPVGEVASIENAATRQTFTLSEGDRYAPTRIHLPPGDYIVTINDAGGAARRERVTVQQGQTAEVSPEWERDLDKLAEEILNR